MSKKGRRVRRKKTSTGRIYVAVIMLFMIGAMTVSQESGLQEDRRDS